MSVGYVLSVPVDLPERLVDLEVEAASEAASAAADSVWWSNLAMLLLLFGLGALGAFWFVAILPGRPATALLAASAGSATLLIIWTVTNPRQATVAAQRRRDVWTELARQARQQRRAAASDGRDPQVWAAYQWLLAQRDALRSAMPLPSHVPVFAPDAAERSEAAP